MPLDLIPSIQKAAHLLALYLERFRRDYGVTQPEAQILAMLDLRRRSSIRDLQRVLGHKPSTLTSILDRLVARGFVTREPGRTDRRSFDVKLTRTGASPAAAIRSALSTLETKVIRRAGAADARTLASVASTLEELVGGRQAERGA
ncbi:MAG: MarR family transcriptional regulator [Vicinamibacterales bacterium]|jgi:DNA-binding MarR family transcriptional regulator|nr:MarR family transcriptional regulator [Acidobacteriota bacterium]MDP7671465.1 MarR family transcriptional regulator [Vicinamibacterales bacterium]HJO38939.1 MarR family transcriptional regulator [Vicinamibacterales bacterium]|tara:strand:- start:250 stop:687 length:438 start_codon:yes stop_codon:yes gene_type:complete